MYEKKHNFFVIFISLYGVENEILPEAQICILIQ
jgi:hypothetical protein